jgi:hypothetical protein
MITLANINLEAKHGTVQASDRRPANACAKKECVQPLA